MLSNARMTAGVVKTRQAKLEMLIAEAGSIKAIGEAMRRAAAAQGDVKAAEKDYANVVSQLKGGKQIGHKIARLLEASMGKPEGWLDDLLAIDQAMEAKEAGQIAMNMKEDRRELWLQMGRAWAAEGLTKPSAAMPFLPAASTKATKRAPNPKRKRGRGHA